MVDDAILSLREKLYKALVKGEDERVIELCGKSPKGALQTLTVHNDTVLHVATYHKKGELVLKLLEEVPQNQHNKLIRQNTAGNTILHEAATANSLIPLAREMLYLVPYLLTMRNQLGETALFRAAHYGEVHMMRFLDQQVDKHIGSLDKEEEAHSKSFYQRNDKTTILHIAILTDNFVTALEIAKKHGFLINELDGDKMTGLQLLACNPTAFESGHKQGFVKRLIYKYWASGAYSAGNSERADKTWCRVPLLEAIRIKKRRHVAAYRLAKFLIQKDRSWEATWPVLDPSKPKTHKYGQISKTESRVSERAASSQQRQEEEDKTLIIAETPLFLATKAGIVEIAKEILEFYPQAAEHIDNHGRTILHIAIKQRQKTIFEMVSRMDLPMRRLTRKIDNDGNSILHMVGLKREGYIPEEEIHNPVFELQENLLLFKHVKEIISTTHVIKHLNNDRESAKELFNSNNEKLRIDAKEWLKRTAEHCSIVGVLIATVAFAAAYTIPGGPNQNTGFPILLNQPFFVVFTAADVLSLAFALASVISFLSILTSPYRLKDFKQSLPQKLLLGLTLLIMSVAMMMVAFAATVILLIHKKEHWTIIALYSISFFPVLILAFNYLRLYRSLLKTFHCVVKKIGKVCPRFSLVCLLRRIVCSSSSTISQTMISSNPSSESQATICSTSSTSLPVLQTTRSPV